MGLLAGRNGRLRDEELEELLGFDDQGEVQHVVAQFTVVFRVLASEFGAGEWSFSDEMSLERGIRARCIRESTTHVDDERRGIEGKAAAGQGCSGWNDSETMKKRMLTSRSFHSSTEGSRFLEYPSKNEPSQDGERGNN